MRAHPGSRRSPHLALDELARLLPGSGVDYRWEPRLGGRRRPDPASRNVAWHDPSFRAYADHMSAPTFRAARTELVAEARTYRTAVMCAEAVWWRCHRRLIADAVELLDQMPVLHLFHHGQTEPHRVMEGARVVDGAVVYDVVPSR